MSATETDVMRRLQDVFRDVLDQPGLVLTRETTADQVEGWDSLTNVRLMVATEMEFGTRFDTAAINSLRNVGDLADLIDAAA